MTTLPESLQLLLRLLTAVSCSNSHIGCTALLCDLIKNTSKIGDRRL